MYVRLRPKASKLSRVQGLGRAARLDSPRMIAGSRAVWNRKNRRLGGAGARPAESPLPDLHDCPLEGAAGHVELEDRAAVHLHAPLLDHAPAFARRSDHAVLV